MKSLLQDASLIAIGGVLYGLGQWLFVAWLTRSQGLELAGHYSFILAVVNPTFLLVGFSLRECLATDACLRYELDQLLTLRLIMAAGATVALVPFFALAHSTALMLALAVIGIKVVEAVADLMFGAMQRNGNSGRVGVSLIAKTVTGIAVAVAMIAADASPAAVLFTMGLIWVVIVFALDRWFAAEAGAPLPSFAALPRWTELREMFSKAAPLTMSAGLAGVGLNIPRYVLNEMNGPEALGLFNALSSFVMLALIVTSALASSSVARLAKVANFGSRRGALAVVLMSSGACVVIALALVGVALVFGDTAVRVAFGSGVAAHSHALPVILLFALPLMLVQPLTMACIALGHRLMVLAGAAAWVGGTLIASLVILPQGGITGAALALGLGALLQVVLSGAAVASAIRRLPSR